MDNEHPMVLDCDGLAWARHIRGEGVLVLKGKEYVKCRINVGRDKVRCLVTLLWYTFGSSSIT